MVLLVCASLLPAVDAYGQHTRDAQLTTAALKAQIDKLTEAIRDLQDTATKSPSNANSPPQAKVDQLVQSVERDEREMRTKFEADERTFEDFRKGESDRVALATQQTVGWFNTIVAVGGGIVTFTGLTISIMVVWFSYRTEILAVGAAKEIAKEHIDKVESKIEASQSKVDKLLEELKEYIAVVKADKEIIEKDLQSAKQARYDTETIFERMRESADLYEEMMVSSGAPGPIGSRPAGGTQSASDAYKDLLRRGNARRDEKKFSGAFQDFEEAERVAPTEEERLRAIDLQADLYRGRGAINEAIDLLQEKLAPLRDVYDDQVFPDAVKLLAGSMLIRLGLLYKESSPVRAIRAYDDASRLVERLDGPAALERYTSAQINKAYRQRQANYYVEAIACFRHVQDRVKFEEVALRPRLAEAIFGEGQTIKDQVSANYDNRRTTHNQEDWQNGFRSAIACFDRLIVFAKDDDPPCRRFCADGLINVGVLRGMLAEQMPEERNLALASLSRVIELFEQDTDPGLKERVEKARLLFARLSGREGA